MAKQPSSDGKLGLKLVIIALQDAERPLLPGKANVFMRIWNYVTRKSQRINKV